MNTARVGIAVLFTIVAASTGFAADLAPWQTKALKLVKAEKTVVDAKWRMADQNVLWVAMQPDGSSRDGFAQYLCMTLNDAGAPTGTLKTIFVYDPESFKSSGRQMGMAACR